MFSKKREMWEFLIHELEYVFSKYVNVPENEITRFFELVLELKSLLARVETECRQFHLDVKSKKV